MAAAIGITRWSPELLGSALIAGRAVVNIMSKNCRAFVDKAWYPHPLRALIDPTGRLPGSAHGAALVSEASGSLPG